RCAPFAAPLRRRPEPRQRPARRRPRACGNSFACGPWLPDLRCNGKRAILPPPDRAHTWCGRRMLCSGRFLAPTLHSGSIEHVNTSSSRRRLRSSAMRALGIALFLLAMRAAAQPTGIISGVVLDAATKAPVPGAVVIAKSPTLLGEQSAVTDESGVFEMTM